MALTFSHSYAVTATVLLNLSLCLLFLFLKIHQKKQSSTQDNIAHNPHSNSTEQKEEKEAKEKETETETEKDQEKVAREGEEKKRKKRARKKKQEGASEDSKEKILADCNDGKEGKETSGTCTGGSGTDSPFPFSPFAIAMQRKIQLKYDELVSSNLANALTAAQVTQFIECLIEARNELQHKSELIQRSFKIKKALLSKADRSSFDRLCNQVFKLEWEHKRLQKDAAVYNVLQEQLKLSEAYKTMLEISDKMKLEENKISNKEQMADFPDISFEELLAQEKKDSFWQKNGKMRSFAN